MGLDIAAYARLERDDSAVSDMDELTHVILERGELELTEKYYPGRTGGLAAGRYRFADTMCFAAGSYPAYGAWRGWLACKTGWISAEQCWSSGAKTGAFLELIDFFDNEGVIGAAVAAKLAQDFARFDHLVQTYERGYSLYRQFRRACEMAADQGAIVFS